MALRGAVSSSGGIPHYIQLDRFLCPIQGIRFAYSSSHMEPLYLLGNMARKLIYMVILGLIAPALALGQEPGITYLDEPYHSVVSLDQFSRPPVPIELENITDSLSDYIVGHDAVHQIGFQLPYFEGQPVGLLRGRQVVVTFPQEFDVSTIHSVSYRDTDDDSADPKIAWIFIYANSVVVRFKDKVPGPEDPHFAYLTLRSVDSPNIARSYQVVVKVDNVLMQTIAGPDFSEPFTLLPSQAQSLEIEPDDAMTLRAGEGIDFEATAVDSYGNVIPTDMIEWSIDPEFDPIGTMYGSFFQATTTGIGRVLASVDDLEASSGLITVTAGDFAALGIDLPETQFIGHPFIGVNPNLFAYDQYGNRVADFDQTGIEIHLSSPSGAITPDMISAAEFVDGIADLSGFTYSGDPGAVTITAEADGVETSTEFYANGVHAIIDEGYNLPAWLLTDWYFYNRGYIWNPADQTPVQLILSAGFIEGNAPDPRITQVRDCIPQPFNGESCRFSVTQDALMDPGAYEYRVTITAVYEFESELINTVSAYSREMPVEEFIPFAYEAIDLPTIGRAIQYSVPASVKLINENSFEFSPLLRTLIGIRSEEMTASMSGLSYSFNWEPERTIDLSVEFNDYLIPGDYIYFVKTDAQYSSPEGEWRIGHRDDFFLSDSLVISEASYPTVKIVSINNDALNTPYVNTGQEFNISALLSNLTDSTIGGPFTVELITDGQSEVPPPYIIPEIPATDTPFVINFAVTAGAESNPIEVFMLRFTDVPDGVQVLPGENSYATVIIQTPANISVVAEIVDHPGVVASLGYSEEFEISGGFENSGMAQADGGTVILNYAGSEDFGIDLPAEMPFDAMENWLLTAPDFDLSSNFTVSLGEIPIDRNTGEPVIMTGNSVFLGFEVQRSQTKLIIEAGGFDTRPLERGVSSMLFELTMQNNTIDLRNTLALELLLIKMVDRDGNPIDAGLLIDEATDDGTNFYLNGNPVGERSPLTGELIYSFPNLKIRGGEVITLEYRLKPKADANLDFFNMSLSGDNIVARIVEGPQAGQRVPVTGLLDRSFEVNLPQSIIPEEFAASFKNYPNPFNPTIKPTEIRYNLPSASDVDIYIYTMTGEEVRHMHFEAGANGGREGLNAGIFWDGYNGNGEMVLNGIYVAYIEVASGGLTAKVKMAVVK